MGKKTRVKNKGKVSGTKLANKHTTKLAKQGKLEHQKKQRKDALKRKKRDKSDNGVPQLNGGSENLEDAHSSIRKKLKKLKRNARSGGAEVESLYDTKRARQWLVEESKALLPIKEKNKVIQRSEKLDHDDSDEDDGTNVDMKLNNNGSSTANKTANGEPLPELAVVDIYAKRVQTLKQLQTTIANMSCAVIEDPEQNVRKLRQLREMWNDEQLVMCVGHKKLLLLSLTEVFKDILPDYSIRITTQAEKQQASSKDTKTLRQYEENLLHNYKAYLQMLEECIGKPGVNKRQENDLAKKSLKVVAVKCMCQVFGKRPTFNFSKNIITVLGSLVAAHNQQIISTICSTFRQIFRQDRDGLISLDIVRAICKTVKARHFHVEPQVVDSFLELKIKEIRTEEEKKKTLTHKEKMRQWSRSQRKLDKKQKALNKELEEAAVEVNQNKVLQTRTDTISAIFTLYFMVLKKAQETKLLSSVLAGLAKFAHLINVDFFDDLFRVFNTLLALETLSTGDVVNITKTAFTILSGQGEALNIDPQYFYTHLYKVLPTFLDEDEHSRIDKLGPLLKLMFIDRKKKVTNARVLSYIKRLVNLSIQLPTESALVMLTGARLLMNSFPFSDILLDTECVGSGIYRPDLDEPEYCNAHNTTILYELHLLANSSDDAVKQCAKLMLKASPDHQREANKRCMICHQTTDELIDLIKAESNNATNKRGPRS